MAESQIWPGWARIRPSVPKAGATGFRELGVGLCWAEDGIVAATPWVEGLGLPRLDGLEEGFVGFWSVMIEDHVISARAKLD